VHGLTPNSLRISGRLFAFLLFFTCFLCMHFISFTMLISLPTVVTLSTNKIIIIIIDKPTSHVITNAGKSF